MTDDELRILLRAEGKGEEEIEIIVANTKSVRSTHSYPASFDDVKDSWPDTYRQMESGQR